MENKNEELVCKNQSESKKSNYFFPVRRNSITAEERGESGKSNLFRDQSYFNCVVSVHLFLFVFVL